VGEVFRVTSGEGTLDTLKPVKGVTLEHVVLGFDFLYHHQRKLVTRGLYHGGGEGGKVTASLLLVALKVTPMVTHFKPHTEA
jgi:hypothetical protein